MKKQNLEKELGGTDKRFLSISERKRLFSKGWKHYSNYDKNEFDNLEDLARLIEKIKVFINNNYEVLLTKAYSNTPRQLDKKMFALWYRKLR